MLPVSADHVVFTYGTLTDPDRVEEVLGPEPHTDRGSATLDGLHRVTGEYPTLAPSGRVDGRLLAVDSSGLLVLDDYEGVDRGLYVRCSVPCVLPAIEADEVWCYVGEPAALGVDVEWPGTGSFDERVHDYLASAAVTVGPRGGTGDGRG